MLLFVEERLSFQPDGVSLCASHPMRLALRQRPAVWGSFRARLSLLPGLGENGAVSYVYERGFFRTPRRRCLTPGRAEFSRHAEEPPFINV